VAAGPERPVDLSGRRPPQTTATVHWITSFHTGRPGGVRRAGWPGRAAARALAR